MEKPHKNGISSNTPLPLGVSASDSKEPAGVHIRKGNRIPAGKGDLGPVSEGGTIPRKGTVEHRGPASASGTVNRGTREREALAASGPLYEGGDLDEEGTIPLGEDDIRWDPSHSKEDDPDDRENDEESDEEGNDDTTEGNTSGNRKRSKRRKIRHTEERICRLVARNRAHTMVLHALYVHRRLTINQMHALYFSTEHIDRIRSNIRKLSTLGLLERRRIFSVAQTVAETRTYHYSLSPVGIRIYALACMGINMLHEDPDLPKQHYWHSDLTIRSQVEHHYILQSFLSECIGTLWSKGQYLPSCEWRRYLYLNQDQEVSYRPDWILLRPNTYFSKKAEEGRIGEDILSVPVLTRTEDDKHIVKEHYHPIVSIECDTGAMRPERLQDKCLRIQREKAFIPKCVALLVGDNKLGEDGRTRWNESKVRIRNIGNAIRGVIAFDLLEDELIFLIGRQSTLSDVVTVYIEHNEDFSKLYPDIERIIHPHYQGCELWSAANWKKRKIETGLPNHTYWDPIKRNVVAIYYAYPGWLNPQIKMNALLENGGEDITCVMVYPTSTHFTQDAHLTWSDRIRYISYDEWSSGEQKYYARIVDRSGEQWEEVVPSQ